MAFPPGDRARADESTPEQSPTVQPLSENDPLAAFAAEQDDEFERGSVAGAFDQFASARDSCVPAVAPIDADLLRADPDEPLGLTLAPPARGRHRVATRTAVAVSIMALVAAAGAYLYPAKPVQLDEQIADALPDAQVFPALVESDPAIAPSEEPHSPAPSEAHTRPPLRETINRNKPPDMERTSALASVEEDLAASASSEVAVASTEADGGQAELSLLSGDWVMNTRVESSRLKRFEGLRLGYRVTLRQHGNRISGTGWKVSEDERTVGATARTPITLTGTLSDDRVELTFTEGGRRRVTGGKLVLARDSENTLRGRFSSTAAQSFGVAEIHR